ncbi:hypothetical protein CBM2634_U170003 [Cupriavidus taiwanensis]|uniref:Uncharacterized protein n=1 Tax=Cupriavidus taiwanensis TaxID=164546 RepID=A0A375JCP1_9BURK|nr:hypothetical protein CBM2634_U170003 [Cupriavidus taiwanensis]
MSAAEDWLRQNLGSSDLCLYIVGPLFAHVRHCSNTRIERKTQLPYARLRSIRFYPTPSVRDRLTRPSLSAPAKDTEPALSRMRLACCKPALSACCSRSRQSTLVRNGCLWSRASVPFDWLARQSRFSELGSTCARRSTVDFDMIRVSIATHTDQAPGHGTATQTHFERFATFLSGKEQKNLRTDFKVSISQTSAITGGPNGNV